MTGKLQQESLYLSVSHHKLHIRHIWQQAGGAPVLMLHGAIENGRIFYTESGKGLACYLAKQGFNVFVADYRGRGGSEPNLKQDSDHGNYETITTDIPALMEHVFERTGQTLHVICHSWGGVLFASSLVRNPRVQALTLSNVCFGTKRQVTVWGLERLFKVSLIWNRLAPLLTRKTGYLDAKRLGFGSDGETHQSLTQSVQWVKKSAWVDPVDGFDYKARAQTIEWPPTWHLTGVKDRVLGHAQDVQLFIAETHNSTAEFTLLSKSAGNKRDYDHIDILTTPEAETDHFKALVIWLHGNEKNE